MNNMHNKFQRSILINKKNIEKGGALGLPEKGCFLVHRRFNLLYMQAYLFPPNIRAKFQIDDKKCGPSAPFQGRFAALGELKEHCRLNLAVFDFWLQKIRHLSKFITVIFILLKRGIISSKICIQI